MAEIQVALHKSKQDQSEKDEFDNQKHELVEVHVTKRTPQLSVSGNTSVEIRKLVNFLAVY